MNYKVTCNQQPRTRGIVTKQAFVSYIYIYILGMLYCCRPKDKLQRIDD